MPYSAPKSIIEVISLLELTEALEADDPRYVDTKEARGSQKTLQLLARKFGVDLAKGQVLAPLRKHVLFFGHVGSGKTTELRQYARELHGPDRLFVVEVDIANHLDRNDLQYAETLMLMARTLLERLTSDPVGISIDQQHLVKLQGWFKERVFINEEIRDYLLEARGEVEMKAEVPFFAKLLSRVTSAFKTNTSYKTSLREAIRNSFIQLADVFNELLRDAEQQLREHHQGQRVLFIVDGTDKLRGEDTTRFFVHDAEQLLAIEALALYTAPLSLKYEGSGHATGRLDTTTVLPMIKIAERNGTRCEPGLKALREILLRRADRSLFASDAEIDRLVGYSGGHPRELLRLLQLCCEFADEDCIDADTVDLAVKQLASEYRRFLEPEDYVLLRQRDTDDVHTGNDKRARRLLYNLALLEYNDGAWQRSHPVVRELEGYRRAAASSTEATTPPAAA